MNKHERFKRWQIIGVLAGAGNLAAAIQSDNGAPLGLVVLQVLACAVLGLAAWCDYSRDVQRRQARRVLRKGGGVEKR